MSAEAAAWAGTVKGRSVFQLEVLRAMASMAVEEGLVAGPLPHLHRIIPGTNRVQTTKAVEALERAGYMTRQWNPDTYCWDFRLRILP